MKAGNEFVEKKHNIGYVTSFFTEKFGDMEFEEKKLPTFQKLPRTMSDAEIESELKPGICTLGDVVAFMDSVPEECRDGNFNLFYTPAFVVDVHWSSDSGGWFVDAWYRDDDWWFSDYRVFSPATDRSDIQTLPSDTLILPDELTINGNLYRRVS